MCGIVAILNVKEQTHELREKALKRLEWYLLWWLCHSRPRATEHCGP